MTEEQPAKSRRTEGRSVASTKELLHTSISQGPFSVLDTAMKDGTRVFIQCRFNKSLLATVVAFDKHFNLVLQDVTELTASENGEQKTRTIRNLFLRGESVIFIVKMNQLSE